MAEIFLDKAKISQRIYYLIFVQCVPLYFGSSESSLQDLARIESCHRNHSFFIICEVFELRRINLS